MNDEVIGRSMINHDFRFRHGLSLNQYVLCDFINRYSQDDKLGYHGWCIISRRELAYRIDLNKQTVVNLVAKMLAKGFLVRHRNQRFLKTSEKWNAVYTYKP